ncbi:MAG: nucleotidyltransferase, partial [Chloroflexi bacterium]
MAITLKESLNQLLDKLGEELDIPDHIYEDAVVQYEAVGEWLDADDSPLKNYTPQIFPQGSFRLGTVVRPLNDDGEYDIDLVCHLTIDKEN